MFKRNMAHTIACNTHRFETEGYQKLIAFNRDAKRGEIANYIQKNSNWHEVSSSGNNICQIFCPTKCQKQECLTINTHLKAITFMKKFAKVLKS